MDQNNEMLLEQLNAFTRRNHTLDEVYLFDLILCDNEIDRDGDCFSDAALAELQKRFVGVTGIFDHNPKSANQTARIFRTELRTEPERLTKAGKPYRCLAANAYMVRTAGNADLIREIDAGIKKEVSISCAVGARVCSVCGKNHLHKPCSHIKGRSYGGKLCYVTLDEPLDAYEWSFVAVPAQRAAGVTKVYGDREVNAEIEKLRAAQERFCEDLRGDIIRLGCFVKSVDIGDTENMDVFGLIELKKKLSRQLRDEAASGRAAGVAAACDGGEMEAFRV